MTRSQDAGGRPPSVGKALVLALVAVGIAALAFLWVPHWILVGLPLESRSLRVGLATGWVGGTFLLASWITWRTSGAQPSGADEAAAPADAP